MKEARGQRWDIFCAVVDNYGDIGVSWRLARQLAAEYGCDVRLWVDDLPSLQRILPEISSGLESQRVAGVEVCQWHPSFPDVAPAEVVIEAFGCELPISYVTAMAALPRQPVWINLEYLSAEKWVGEYHGLSSPHPRLPLIKYFFFPGFTSQTGGLLVESGLEGRRREFQDSPELKQAFWRSVNMSPPGEDECRVSLFGYENPALHGLLAAWSLSSSPVTCLVPEGRLVAGVASFLELPRLECDRDHKRGNLAVRVLPFMDQLHYDAFLWACDCNFVRGEDSFVRAQWAARPFAWHIYPQQEDAHWVKLGAFLDHYCAALPLEAASDVRVFWEAWNRGSGAGDAWPGFWRHRPVLEQHAQQWSEYLLKQGGLASSLVQFCNKRL
ncbi:MAG: elongation factor P maturation arginine rhamnosyltransferase EarP [Sulfuricella denitrificans]|nr:elongation factor P maturation arginine rhamnosyltransferase EarP [Sulfuricella denitrificans]